MEIIYTNVKKMLEAKQMPVGIFMRKANISKMSLLKGNLSLSKLESVSEALDVDIPMLLSTEKTENHINQLHENTANYPESLSTKAEVL